MKLGEGGRDLKEEKRDQKMIGKIVKENQSNLHKLDIDDGSLAKDGRVNMDHFNEQNITLEKIKEYLPKKSQVRITQDIVDEINSVQDDINLNQNFFEERFMTNLSLCTDRGVGLEKYVQALKYVELTNYYTNQKAWSIVFPREHKRLVDAGMAIANHVHSFERSKTVLALRKAAIIPEYISNYPGRQKMFYKLGQLVEGKGAIEGQIVSAHVQFLAAKEYLDQTKMPEDNTIQLKIGASDALLEQQQSMANSMAQIVEMQREAYKNGGDLAKLQQIHIVTDDDDEVIDV